jgi:phage baseplate assembly protein W
MSSSSTLYTGHCRGFRRYICIWSIIMAKVNRFTIRNKNPILYTDFKSSFEININSLDLEMIENEDAIKESMKNFFYTQIGERFYNPEWGTRIWGLLFENNTVDLKRKLEDECLRYKDFDPRIENLSVSVDNVESYSNANEVRLNIYYKLINIPKEGNLELVLKRIR